MRRLLLVLCTVLALSACGVQEEPPASTTPRLHKTVEKKEPYPEHSRVPTRLRVWHYDARVVPIEPEGGVLVPPSDPTVLGWWGARSGAKSGTTLLTGHTVHTGGGTFDDLEDIPVGSVASLNGIRYRVVQVEIVTKDELALRSSKLFRQTGKNRLVLVTCEGYDSSTGTYADNVVVVAVRLR